MRWLACGMIVICSLLTGMSCRDRLRRKVKFLDEMLTFLRSMISQISYSSLPPDKLIENASGQFFRLCRVHTGPEGDVRAGWTRAMENSAEINLLDANERQMIGRIGNSLGIYDAEQQLVVSRADMKELERMKERAVRQLDERGKIYITCSVLLGTLTAILII